jgi:deoxyribonuclease-4
MPHLGAHMSVAGGLHLAFDRLATVNGRALQIFTKNQRQWKESDLAPESVERFRQKWDDSGRIPVAAHDVYLINLAAPQSEIEVKSISAFAGELHRCAALGIPYLIMHPGAHMGEGVERGLERLVRNLDRAMEEARTDSVSVLIENTAGQGSSLGWSFEQIAFILSASRYGKTMGVCFDTSHAFAAGYDIAAQSAYRDTMKRFDEIIGLERLKFFHVNDSKKGLGSRVDRHEHIGKGEIGLEGFRLLLNDPRFKNHPMVLETPKGKDLAEDRENLAVLQSLMGKT